jgi:ATP-dependent DNA helicase RecQ
MDELEDVTELARKLFTSIIDLRENYGTLYCIDFLRGSNAAHLRDEHKSLPSYGSGCETTKAKWKKLVQEMLDQGYLAKTSGMFPQIRMTRKGRDILEANGNVFINKLPEFENDQVSEFEYEHQLYVRLRKLQMAIAKELGVATYIVLPENTLLLLAAFLPHTKEELRVIKGFGDLKSEKYGQQFLDVIIDYCKSNELSSRIPTNSEPITYHLSRTREQTFNLFKEGRSVTEIAEIRKLASSTVERHLAFFIRIGRLQLNQVMDTKKIAQIHDAVQRVGRESLGAIQEKLGKHYSYAEIRYVIAYMDFESKESWTDAYYRIEQDGPLLFCD